MPDPHTNPSIHNSVRSALEALLQPEHPVQLTAELMKIFSSTGDFLEKTRSLDTFIDQYKELDGAREIFFDLLMVNFLSTDSRFKDDDYFESPEWLRIEDKTIDRGTELLNLFLYIQESKDDGIIPELDNFLNDFLLVHEDGFQDELNIYEDVLKNHEVIDTDLQQIASVARSLSEKSEMKELFLPLMAFFYNIEHPVEFSALTELAVSPETEVPAFRALKGFYTIN